MIEYIWGSWQCILSPHPLGRREFFHTGCNAVQQTCNHLRNQRTRDCRAILWILYELLKSEKSEDEIHRQCVISSDNVCLSIFLHVESMQPWFKPSYFVTDCCWASFSLLKSYLALDNTT